jgi:hypothetical protein
VIVRLAVYERLAQWPLRRRHVRRPELPHVGRRSNPVTAAGRSNINDARAARGSWPRNAKGDNADDAQYGSLTSIFLGRAGGTVLENFVSAIGTVHEVRRARIRLSHVPRRWFIRAATFVSVAARVPVEAPAPVACGIPGFDRPGQEVIADELWVNDPPLHWDLHERCGFATGFEYQGGARQRAAGPTTARRP